VFNRAPVSVGPVSSASAGVLMHGVQIQERRDGILSSAPPSCHASMHTRVIPAAVQSQPQLASVQKASGLVLGSNGSACLFNGGAALPGHQPQAPVLSPVPGRITSRLPLAADDKVEVAQSFVEQRRSSSDQRDQAYTAFVKALADWGVFDALPVDPSGILRVSAPFCHDFFEAPLLLPFLLERIVDTGFAKGISAFGSDVRPQPMWWPAWEQWTAHVLGPRAMLRLAQQDLEKEAPPEADLILGFHPEVTNGGPWPRILGNVLRSCSPGGQCVFGTFYRQEAEAAAQVCRDHGMGSSVRENPHYLGQPESTVGTFYRYAVILTRATGTGPCREPLAPAASASMAQQVTPLVQAGPALPPASAQVLQAPPQAAPQASGAAVLDSTVRWVERRRASPDHRDKAYGAFLQALADWGVLERLPTDSAGALQVSVPFCQELFEAPLLLPFLRRRLLERGGASGISAFGCDVEPQPFWWPAWEAWAAHALGPEVRLELRQRDLAMEPLPPAGLILAVHPEVTKGGPWQSILSNVLQSRVAGGQCVFATFYSMEAQETVKLCQGLGARCEVRENPYYAGQPDGVGTFLRFAVIVSR